MAVKKNRVTTDNFKARMANLPLSTLARTTASTIRAAE